MAAGMSCASRPRLHNEGHDVVMPALEGGAGLGLAWALGDESDADQRIDAQAQTHAALTEAIRSGFGRRTPIQRCQVHNARNMIDRLPNPLHASMSEALRQAWDLARRLWQGAPASPRASTKALTRC